ncbi:MAG: 4-hydroxythreonine-4-phosphate dehydrogenase PdxA [Zoogloeaceae bacterium]|nr:4-hydroxythreonine-4-phosphate dehydrogenase PdxA [Zoogloeaceae bacterium]
MNRRDSSSSGALPRVALTTGEPAGIGPDICLALAGVPLNCRPVLLADRDLLERRARQLGKAVALTEYDPGRTPPKGALEVLSLPLNAPVTAGRLDPDNGDYVLALLDRAVSGCLAGEFSALVTAPLHKGVIARAALPRAPGFSGHTEYLAQQTRTRRVVMMLAGDTERGHADGTLRVALASTHLPLKDVAAAVTRESLTETLEILCRELRAKYGFSSPRILVAGMNPHAGEEGHMGREELEVISPVLETLRQRGDMTLIGPLPADTLFTPPILAQGDAVLAMYHDQGLAPLKYATFGRGVNVTLGLPLIRTSVDHGTALPLAGSGKANAGSLFAAIAEARRMMDFVSVSAR